MKSTTKDLVFIALSTTIIIVCSFISIPFYVPFTMQTFAIFTIIGLFGTKKAFVSVSLYLLLGAIGLPVFSGFRGGVGNLLGVTGGYLIGFLLTCLISGFLLSFFKKQKKANVVTFCISMALGLIVCYAFGTAWYIVLYTNSTGSVSITSVLSLCVFPFLLPDALKMGLSYYVIKVAKKPLSKLLL